MAKSPAPRAYAKAKVSYEDFKTLVSEVEKHRASRLVNLEQFLEMSKDKNTIILDTRSEYRFNRIHLKGAKNLSFPDFTQLNLARTIPSMETRVLIYCNNNFEGNEEDFASKVGLPMGMPSDLGSGARRSRPTATVSRPEVESQMAIQAKPLMLALNVPTYVTLFGYGYRNVYELDELVNVNDPRVTFSGSIVGPSSENGK